VAQATYDQFDRASQAAMKKVMLRLIQVSVGAAPGLATRLIEDFEKPVEDMVQRFVQSGIVQISGTNAIIADKRIVEGWHLLRQWAKDDENFLLWRQGLTVSAGSWLRAGRDPSALLRGKVLEDAAKWLELRSDDLNEAEREFIRSSKKFEDQRTPTTVAIRFPGTR
jgi:hypothetical protein